ncbi:Wound-responsive family protein [Raphanus sativus]|uniref:Bifunctional nuclease 2 n=1 Tax=Raphanus sativus TaxID=3726 RepID=A0A6J0L9L9_RAPSA|nr:bifunctional nuclease 2 [Raphanus sativus]KAJ4878738.1 Wound-responsive family protein [Raphanus sativus]
MPGVAFSSVASSSSDLGIFFSEVTAYSRRISASLSSSSSSFRCCILPLKLNIRSLRSRKLPPICCDSSSTSRSGLGDPDLEFLQASVLVAETSMHYKMRRHGFREDSIWQASRHLPPFAVRASESRVGVLPIGLGFLRQFTHPTIFLKISCDGDYLLPLIVADSAVEKLLDVPPLQGPIEECPDQFHFVSSLVDKLGHEVKMVKLTSRVFNTYYASLYLGKPGDNDVICIDSRPSDAINVARACQAPIYVNKSIVLEDAIKIGYGGRPQSTKPIFNVILDSAPEGPDPISEELKLLSNMDLASKEERYTDAAMWRDRLKKLQNSSSVVYEGVATPESYD